jgi:iron complex outermembrane receptor protein
MKKSVLLGGATPLFALLALGTGVAAAQDQAGEQELVITGSFIRGTPENAALPVNVINAEELEQRGAPTTVELIKALSVSSGVQGDTNQFDSRAQGAEGSGTVNLRGLGPERTLVLLNGRRMALNPFGLVGSTVDTNKIPSAAIGRIEVLKDGAAATYGSDAVAGVVNFITKTDFNGFEVGGDYKYIDGSDGNYNYFANAGFAGERASLFVSGGMQVKSQLPSLEREWATRPYLENPQGGWSSFGNPSIYVPLSAGGAALGLIRDPRCAAVGAFPGFTGTTPACYFNFVRFDNLVEDESRYQLFASFDLDVAPQHSIHVEGLYTNTITPNWLTSPGYITLQQPTAPAAIVPGAYITTAANPWFQDFAAKNPGVFPATTALINLPLHRPLGWGGNPLFPENNFASEGKRGWEAFRISAGMNGTWDNGIGYDVSVTFMEDSAVRTGFDILANRFQLALRGLGGANCRGSTPGANGCLWWNPFSTSIERNVISGDVNPQFNAASLAANTEILRWMYAFQRTDQTSTLTTFDAVLNGELPLTLGDGKVGWAIGAQVRDSGFETQFNPVADLTVTPCVSSIDFNINTCTAITGPNIFLGGGFPADISRDVNAAFFEFSLPFAERFNARVSGRYEDYGGATGSTFNPQINAKLQLADWLALRGSAGSTFRGPSLSNTQLGSVTAFNFVLGAFRAIDIFGNPNLEPEKADTFNLGLIAEAGGLTAKIDVWQFKFEDQIVAEPTEAIANSFFPGGTSTANCANPAFAALRNRFTFSALGCVPGGVSRIRTQVTNGPAVDTAGIDLDLEYRFEDVVGGDLAFKLDGTYTLKYAVEDFFVEGIKVQSAFDATNKLNAGLAYYPLPKYKGTFSIAYQRPSQSLRYALNFVDDYIDQRTSPFIATTSHSPNPVTPVANAIPGGKVIDRQITHDLTYRADLPFESTLLLSVENFTDEDPAFARLDLSYDPFTGNPLGRTVKIGLRKRFGGS